MELDKYKRLVELVGQKLTKDEHKEYKELMSEFDALVKTYWGIKSEVCKKHNVQVNYVNSVLVGFARGGRGGKAKEIIETIIELIPHYAEIAKKNKERIDRVEKMKIDMGNTETGHFLGLYRGINKSVAKELGLSPTAITFIMQKYQFPENIDEVLDAIEKEIKARKADL